MATKQRKDLHAKLEALVPNVYFQPTSNTKLKYPCIIYSLAKINNYEANNNTYLIYKRYDVTVISSDSDNNIAEKMVADFDYCFYSRRYVADNLYHDALVIYW